MLHDSREDLGSIKIRIGSRNTAHSQTNLDTWSRDVNDQCSWVCRSWLAKGGGHDLFAFAPWSEQLAQGPHRARFCYTADDRERGVVGIQEAIAGLHQIGAVDTTDVFG